jgi:hypothetical protein
LALILYNARFKPILDKPQPNGLWFLVMAVGLANGHGLGLEPEIAG